MIRERQTRVATADSSELSSFPLSELSLDYSGPPTVLQGSYIPLSTSTPIHVPQGNQQMTDSAPDESPFQQVIPSIPQQSLYPSLAVLGTSVNTAVSPPIFFSRRVINDIEEQQRKFLEDTVEGNIRSINTLPISDAEEQEQEVIIPSLNLQTGIMQADTQEETLQLESSEIEDTGFKKVDIQEDQNTGPTEDQNTGPTETQNTGDADKRAVPDSIDSQIEEDGTTPENDGDDYRSDNQDPAMQDDQTSKASQDDNCHTAIDDDGGLDDTVQFGNPVTQPFVSRSVRVPTTEVGCLSFTQMFQDYLHEYPPPSQADTYLQIQEMAQRLDMYLNRYPAQYINCMTSNSELVAFVNHAIQLALDLTAYPNIWAVLLILLETQDVNTSYLQVMHDYYNECYNTKTEEYMIRLEQAAERSKNNMYNITLDGVSAYTQQQVCNP